MRVSGGTVYGKFAQTLIQSYAKMEKDLAEPLVIARLIKESIEAKKPGYHPIFPEQDQKKCP